MDDETVQDDTAAGMFPFREVKIPVCRGVRELRELATRYHPFSFCPYLAHKDDEGWKKSTSRVYMNRVLPGFLYIPVDIAKGDMPALREFFDTVRDDPKVVAVNITQPHKSNPVLMREYAGGGSPENIDTLIRSGNGSLVPFDLNAPSFMDWYADNVGSLAGKTILLIGVGGVGEPLARRFAEAGPSKLFLVDPNDKTELTRQIMVKADVSYAPDIGAVGLLPGDDNIVVINAAGKEGALPCSGLEEWLAAGKPHGGVFVDLRPQLDIDTVRRASALGWKAFTGYGMNARNDYSLLKGIAANMGVEPPPFDGFAELVAEAS